MKKRKLRNATTMLLLAGVLSCSLAGCKTPTKSEDSISEEQSESVLSTESLTQEETESEESSPEVPTAEIANPWIDSDREGVLENTGFDMPAPDGASDIYYSYTSDGNLAELSYTRDGIIWGYRMAYADALTDISGLYVEWTSEEAGTVLERNAIYYSYTNEDISLGEINATTNQLVIWYDEVTGVTYSLSAYASDLNGLDIQAYAESIYEPLQGDVTENVTEDATADATEEGENDD